METSTGVPLISMRPFPAAEWSAWLVSKVPHRLSVSLHSYTKSATYLTAPPAVVFLQRAHKYTPVTKTLCSQYCTKTKKRAGMPALGEVGSETRDIKICLRDMKIISVTKENFRKFSR